MSSQTKELSDDTVAKMTAAINTFKAQFVSSAAQQVNEAQADAEGSDGNEQITRFKK